jgi:hypothetical protein
MDIPGVGQRLVRQVHEERHSLSPAFQAREGKSHFFRTNIMKNKLFSINFITNLIRLELFQIRWCGWPNFGAHTYYLDKYS